MTTILIRLPSGIQREITSYLISNEIHSYASTCKQIKSDLNLAILTDAHRPILEIARNNRDCRRHFWTELTPFFLPDPLIHSVRFICDWKDQGWGNRKGHIFITEINSNNDNIEGENGLVVASSSSVAEHHWTKLQLEFMPQSDKIYKLMYRVGGGGGHELFVENIRMKYLIYDGVNVSEICRNLAVQAPCSSWNAFFIDMMKAVVESILSHVNEGKVPDCHLTAMLQSKIGSSMDWTNTKSLLGLKQFLNGIERQVQCIQRHVPVQDMHEREERRMLRLSFDNEYYESDGMFGDYDSDGTSDYGA